MYEHARLLTRAFKIKGHINTWLLTRFLLPPCRNRSHSLQVAEGTLPTMCMAHAVSCSCDQARSQIAYDESVGVSHCSLISKESCHLQHASQSVSTVSRVHNASHRTSDTRRTEWSIDTSLLGNFYSLITTSDASSPVAVSTFNGTVSELPRKLVPMGDSVHQKGS